MNFMINQKSLAEIMISLSTQEVFTLGMSNSTAPDVQTDVQVEIETLTATKTMRQFKVVLFNDEDHSYDYVVELLTKICRLTKEQAFRCAVEVDLTGRTIVFYGDREKCENISHKINNYGPDYRMPKSLNSMESAVEEF